MTEFKSFIKAVREIGGKWASDDVYFFQMRDGYSATYKPEYPSSSNLDMRICTLHDTGAQNRGNYELIVCEDGKFVCKYYKTLQEIAERI